ncbi:MAG: SDR family oxidoreductase [Thermogutta sp.]|nr:SDR family oxidoreductase [Thermogutta sp.]
MKTSSEETSRRVALITGAGKRRVGYYIAQTMADRGFDLAIHYNRSREEARQTVASLIEKGARAAEFRADVSKPASIDRMFAQIQDRFGRLDLLVTSAAIWTPTRLEEMTPDDVRRHFEVNALGTFWCCRAAGLMMAQQPEGGLIVTIGDWAVERPYLNYPAYFVSKGCIPAMTRMLAVELAHRNPAIRVNCVHPGPVMLPAALSKHEKLQAIRATLLKREGSPRHIAKAVEFFWDNDFITGVCLTVDGGRTIA